MAGETTVLAGAIVLGVPHSEELGPEQQSAAVPRTKQHTSRRDVAHAPALAQEALKPVRFGAQVRSRRAALAVAATGR